MIGMCDRREDDGCCLLFCIDDIAAMITRDKPVIVTAALPYVNGECHIGHLRTYVPADVFVRMLRKMGYDVLFVCGSDTHGTPIVLSAESEGVSPEEIVRRYHEHFRRVFSDLRVCFDYYGSTDDESNHRRTREIVEKLMERGYVYERKVMLAFCERCGRFLPDRYVEGVCPYCGERARGDECDQGCGRHLEPGEIREPVCKVCGSPAKFRERTHYYFRLSAFADFLLSFLKNLGGTANARNYAIEWVRRELKDWCITRDLKWGVKFPNRDDLVVYVWVDAPIGYISFTEEALKLKDSENWERRWREIWMENRATIIHFIGTDIIYHHCIFWPAMLKGAEYSLPSAVVASGMMTINGKPLSKSRGNVIWVADFIKRFHPDTLRYFLIAHSSHTKELDFSWEAFRTRVNNELLAILGNLAFRVLSFAHKHFGAEVPDGEIEDEVISHIIKTRDEAVNALFEYEFKRMTDSIMKLADFGNSYFQREEPWHLIKSDEKDRKRCGEIVKNTLQILKAVCVLLEPVMPSKMEELWKQLGMESDIHEVSMNEITIPLKSGQPLEKPEKLFKPVMS